MPELGVDYSFARPDPNAIKAAGYTFVIRYVAPTSESGKTLSSQEAAALHAAGLKILLVFEDGAQNALGGAAQGTTDGNIAKTAAEALGYPQSCPIFAAVDFDATAAQVPTIDAYFEAFKAAIAPWPAGTYGDEAVGDSEPGLEYWETEAWDGTSVDGHAALYQRVRPTVASPVAGTDENVLLQPVAMWLPEVTPPAPPAVVVTAAAPAFPLTAGNWYGPVSKNPRNHSGFWAADRPGIRAYQTQMRERGWHQIAVTGVFDAPTEIVTREFQAEKHLAVDGLVGPATWDAAWKDPVT